MNAGVRQSLIALVLGCLAPAGSTPAAAQMGLSFASEAHDFGTLQQGDPFEADFAFENRGVVPLTLSQPITACECAAEIVGSADLAVGDRGRLRVTCDTSQMSGAVRRTVTIHVSDVERRSVLLSMTGEVLLDVLTDPPQVYLGHVLHGQRVDRAFSVRLGSDGVRSTAVRGAHTSGPYIDVDWRPGDVDVSLILRDDAPLGVFEQTVTLVTNSKRFPTRTVPVTGIVVEALPARRW